MNEYILETKGLTKVYSGSKPALDTVSLGIEKGRIVGLLGPNGSGKTTLIKLVNGLLSPTSGEILIDGMAPGVETKKIVSYLPDKDFLASWMTVKQALDYFCDFFADFRRERAEKMLSNLGIEQNQKIKTLSKGNREKVALILTMSREAKLYLLDEPIAGVDPATRDYILNTIISNYAENSTVIISTHLIADVEPVLNDVIFIKDGRIEMFRSAEEIREAEGKSVDALFREVYRW
ncbi:MAG: ABC transporter ATP-binding protein [Clostridia bacterium]|nr:ABC transporter ATP-binding protein [Clostridia bacterium]